MLTHATYILFGAPIRDDALAFRRDLWQHKPEYLVPRVQRYFPILRRAVLVQCRLETNGQTDTRRQHVPRYHRFAR